MLPIPCDTRKLFQSNRSECDNAYLLLNRFLEGEETEKKFFDTQESREKLFDLLKGIKFNLTPHKERLKQTLCRLKESGFHTNWVELKTESRMVVGLGDSNALEVGLSLHPLYGFPYIPGSSLKGLCRSWLEIAEDEFEGMNDPLAGKELEKKIREESYTVFGSHSKTDDSEENKLGDVTFFDAIPTEEPEFDVDIMTPHYEPYYSNPGENPPGDWYDPIIIKFLTVAPETKFIFALSSLKQSSLKKARKWLIQGLTELGVGAKTSSGYGYFLHPEVEEKRMEKLRKKREAERPDWAKEREERIKQRIKKERERSPEDKIKKLILEGNPSNDFYSAFEIWKELDDSNTKQELAQLFFETDPKYMKKKKKKSWYKELVEYLNI